MRETRAGLQQESDVAHFLVCKHGHHRSVALLEILHQSLREEMPDTEIIVFHLDHFKRGGKNRNLDFVHWLESARFDVWEEIFEEPILSALLHPPSQLVHREYK